MSSIVLAGRQVWDGTGLAAHPADVVVRDGLIAAVGSGARAQHRDVPVVDVTGCVLLPGLLDVHVHLTMDADALNKNGLGENDTFTVLRAARGGGGGRTVLRDV